MRGLRSYAKARGTLLYAVRARIFEYAPTPATLEADAA
eukprot:CAMPEP_0116012496 /NCGR_PEP_ID=MMETSP0321-20121206/5158_1 /TAXON_ID=163516 /ORGANISM="Leptocylindrus danicus var. danicus, Strain B650" /LENGTH=37 /DNA_ID= /DNA_START= /DNA_END= /DNA_ORIENTATION=